jgi:hypothetical protein
MLRTVFSNLLEAFDVVRQIGCLRGGQREAFAVWTFFASLSFRQKLLDLIRG